EDYAQYDGSAGAPEDAPPPLSFRKIPARECDDHCVVAGQQDIDNDDLKRCDPKLRRCELHTALPDLLTADRQCCAACSVDLSSLPISAGVLVTRMPHASMTANFSCAVPLPPAMIAPA